jgi:hypothetical protein
MHGYGILTYANGKIAYQGNWYFSILKQEKWLFYWSRSPFQLKS